MKRLLSIILAVAVVSLVAISCKDTFNEEDFLRLQSELKLKQDSINRLRNRTLFDSSSRESVQSYTAALNEAGDLMSLTVMVRENNVAVPGVAVTLITGSSAVAGGKKQLVTTVTADGSGNAVFDRVPIGLVNIQLVLAGYVAATATVNLGTPGDVIAVNVPLPNGGTIVTYLPPQKQHEAAILPLFNKTGTNTATIQGFVTAEFDVTNKTREIPQNLVLSADISDLISATGTIGPIVTNSYRFDDGNFGTATVNNSTGAYSMVVPAGTQPYDVNIIFPTFTANQHIAVARVDGTSLPGGPEYRDVPTSFGPNAGPYDNIPGIAGAKAVFSAPPAAGAGLNFTFTSRSRPLGSWTTNTGDFNPNVGGTQGVNFGDPANFDIDETVYQSTSRGSGYTAAPVISVSGGNGLGTVAVIKASLRGRFTTVGIGNGGANYAVGDFIQVSFNIKDGATPVPVTQSVTSFFAEVATVNAGAITGLTLPTSGEGFDEDYITSNLSRGFDIAQFETTNATISGAGTGAAVVMSFTSEIEHFKLSNGGSNYTSAPTITINNGATLAVKEFRTQWNVTSPTRTTAYPILPEAVNLEHTGMNSGVTRSPNFASNAGAVNILNALDLTAAGDPIFANSGETYRTALFSATAPKVIEDVNEAIPASGSMVLNTVNGVQSLGVTVNSDGRIGGINTQAPGAGFSGAGPVNGNGYKALPTVTISPSAATAPGAGAVVDIQPNVVFDQATGEFQWTAAAGTVLNSGSGYHEDLNQQRLTTGSGLGAGVVSFPSSLSVQVTSGLVINFDIYAGTGNKLQNVNP